MFRYSIKVIALILVTAFCQGCKEEEELPPLKVFRIEPAIAKYGDTIRIAGQGFSPGYTYNNIIFQGGVIADALPGSTTEMLLVEIPDGATSGIMTVDILSRESSATPFIDVLLPVIHQITPAEAWIGDTLTIAGENFNPTKFRNHVKTGRADATTVRASLTELKVVVLQGAEDGPVSVMGVEGPAFNVKASEILSFTPTHAVVGDTIEIYGLGMSAPQVSFNPAMLGELLEDESTSRKLRVIVPPGATDGKLKIQNRVNNSVVTLETSAVFEVYPVINGMSPLSGFPGTPVTLSGFNFSTVASENEVTFNGTSATVTKASATELIVAAPTGFTTGRIRVTVNGREAFGGIFAVAEAGSPVISSISPNNGPVGSQVMITGINFATTPTANTVKFSGNATARVVSASATQLIVEVPASAASGPITVTKDGKIGVTPSFTVTTIIVPFISSISPSSSPRNGTVTVNGGNFVAGLVLTATSPFQIVSVTPTQVVAKVPNTLLLGYYDVYVSQSGKVSNRVTLEVTGTPSISSVDVTEGAPGVIVTLTGNDFNPEENKNIVKFGTTTANWVNLNDPSHNLVKVYVPNVAPGTYNITVTAYGITSNSISFTVEEKQQAVRNIIYTENAQPRFSVKRRISDPPSESTLYTRPFSVSSFNVVTIDLEKQLAFFPDLEAYVIARSDFDQTGDRIVYQLSELGLGALIDLTLDTENEKLFFSDNLGNVYAGDYEGSSPPEILFEYAVDNIVPLGISYEPDDNSLYIISSLPGFVTASILRGSVDGNELTELFTESDGMINAIDVKVDAGEDKLFVLDNYRTIKVGARDGSGTLSTWITRDHDMLGIALDKQDHYVYWMEYVNESETQASVFRMKYDKSGTVEEVYGNIAQGPDVGDPFSGMMSGLALEDTSGSGAGRSSKSFSPGMKTKRKFDQSKMRLRK